MFDEIPVASLLAGVSAVTLIVSVVALTLLVLLLGGKDVLGEVFLGIGRVLASIVLAPIQFLRRVIDGLARGRGMFDGAADGPGNSFLLLRVGQLLYAFVLLTTAVLLAAILVGTVGLAFPKELREYRASLKDEIVRIDSVTIVRQQAIDTLQTLTSTGALQQQTRDLELTDQRLRAARRGYSLRDSVDIWPALVSDFYDRAWRPNTNSQDNVADNTASRDQLRSAVATWDARITQLLADSSITGEQLELATAGKPRILAFAQTLITQTDTLVDVTARLDALRNTARAITDLEENLAGLENQRSAVEATLSERHVLSEVSNGVKFLALGCVGLLFFVWVCGVGTESFLLLVTLGRDVAIIRAQGERDRTG